MWHAAIDHSKQNRGEAKEFYATLVELANTSAFHAEDQGFDPPRQYHRSLAEFSVTTKTVIITATTWGVSTRNQSRQDAHIKGIVMTRDTGPHLAFRQCRTVRARQKLNTAVYCDKQATPLGGKVSPVMPGTKGFHVNNARGRCIITAPLFCAPKPAFSIFLGHIVCPP